MFLMLSWVIPWLLSIPLYHIHALNGQENPAHSSSFLPHTLFSGDLPGEYSIGEDGREKAAHDQQSVQVHFPRYSEINFDLEDDDGNKSGVQPSPIALLTRRHLDLPLLLQRSLSVDITRGPSRVDSPSLPSRSPPRALSGFHQVHSDNA